MNTIQPHDRQSIPGIKDMVAVSSGKGGVGKSTICANLALALAQRGLAVGLLDTDIYGPNIPGMLSVKDRPVTSPENGRILPLESHGLKTISMGLLIDAGTPVIWRGPMLAKIMNQFLFQVEWGTLDVLLLDLPPGTGDVQITLTQSAPLSGALIVTTPSQLALEDVHRGVQMFRQSEVPILGLVENMGDFVCDNCNKSSTPFDAGGGRRTAEHFSIPFLGQIPLDPQLRICADSGTPAVVAAPQSPSALALQEVAEQIPGLLAQNRDQTPVSD